jgi:two-component system chemotaxis response regulator CheB
MAVTRDITVVGASAGGVAALRELLQGLPADHPAAMFVVLHVGPDSPKVLHRILDARSPLPVRTARGGDTIRRGQVLVAPPNQQMVLERHSVRLTNGPRENRHRPSIDVLFRSAAVAFGPRVTGVVLTGMLDDGSAGLWAVKRRGGVAVVQHPADAEFPDMPRNALDTVAVDHSVPLVRLPDLLTELAREPVEESIDAVPPTMAHEVHTAMDKREMMETLDRLGQRVSLTCPECGGALWELDDTGAQRFRCHVGHAYSVQTLASEQSIRVEAALWAALRSLEENERLALRMASEAKRRGHQPLATSMARTPGEAPRTPRSCADSWQASCRSRRKPRRTPPDRSMSRVGSR